MKRREFITLLGGAAARGRSRRARSSRRCRPSGSWARPRLATESQRLAAFVQRLRELGWIEGRTVAIEFRWAEGRTRALCRDRGRICPAEGRCHCHGGTPRSWPQSRRPRHPHRFRERRATRSAAAWSRRWHDRAATSPACQFNAPTSPASDSRFCARLCPMCAGWRSLAMSAYAATVLEMSEVRQRPARSASRPPRSKSGEQRISRPPSRRSRARRRRFMSSRCASFNANRARINTLALGARLPTMHGVREYVESGGLMSYGPNLADLYRRAADLRRQDSARGEAGRPAGRAADQVRFGHQPVTTAKALGLDCAADAARPRRRGDRMKRREFITLLGGAAAAGRSRRARSSGSGCGALACS